ncbi:DUF2252 domain-containing protein [soil metagenome]
MITMPTSGQPVPTPAKARTDRPRNGAPTPSPDHDTDSRLAELARARSLKMARSAHAYVRGSTLKFYEWLDEARRTALPEGPSIWICGDCHVGNLGPVANDLGEVEIQIRDFDQTVIGNPVHDLIRLGLSLAMALRSSDLPGVTTALMIEHMMTGYLSAFQGNGSAPDSKKERPTSVHVALKEANRRTWKHLAQERLNGRTARIPLGARFWQISGQERDDIRALCREPETVGLIKQLRQRGASADVQFLDAAYWKKGCSSLGKLRFAVMLDIDGLATKGRDLCLTDIKEAVKAAAPRDQSAAMPREYAQRVVEGATRMSPFLGERMVATRLGDRSVFIRELLPADLKLELGTIGVEEAKRAARYLSAVVGRAHARQLDVATRHSWQAELKRSQSKSLDAPSWLWNSIVELVGTHERGYLDHCRQYALESTRKIERIREQPA